MNFDKLWDITELQYNILNHFGCDDVPTELIDHRFEIRDDRVVHHLDTQPNPKFHFRDSSFVTCLQPDHIRVEKFNASLHYKLGDDNG